MTDWIKIPEACMILREGYNYVYQLVMTGEIASRRVGNRWEVLGREVEAHRDARDKKRDKEQAS